MGDPPPRPSLTLGLSSYSDSACPSGVVVSAFAGLLNALLGLASPWGSISDSLASTKVLLRRFLR